MPALIVSPQRDQARVKLTCIGLPKALLASLDVKQTPRIECVADVPECVRRQARDALPVLEQLAAYPATKESVSRILARLVIAFSFIERSDAEWDSFWIQCFELFVGLPECRLAAAVDAYLRDPSNRFPPRPEVLRALMDTTPTPELFALGRARLLAKSLDDPRQSNKRDDAHKVAWSLDHQAEVMEMAAATVRKLQTPQRPTYIPALRQAKVDGTGTSEELRALIARQRDQADEGGGGG